VARGSLEGRWVWRIAIRTALEHRVGREVASLNGALDPSLVEEERDPALAQALRRLSPRRRLMIFLRYYADLSYAQIADACSVTEGTVAATLAHARDDLLDALEEARIARGPCPQALRAGTAVLHRAGGRTRPGLLRQVAAHQGASP
jgi:DNA-directed RNA polymerase specialized sigma24 family protein